MTVTDLDPSQPAGPYATAATAYRRAGWSPLPLPHGQKKPVPVGWTGRDGAWPSGADVQAWTEDHGSGNIALRMPPNVLGIDVDDYKDKPGAHVLDALEAQHGPLPATWMSSSRGGRSGIRFYRIPEGLRWPGILGPGIETIRTDHRYAVAWPSLHPEGGTYRWTRPDGAIALDSAVEVPQVDDLPALPDSWVKAVTNGELATEQPRADLTDTAASAWLTARAGMPPCRHTARALDRGLTDLQAATSRHDTALSLTNRLVWLAGEGHHGIDHALGAARTAFLAATATDRAPDEAALEWTRMVAGAVRLSAAAHPAAQPDPCDDPFAGLIPKENPWPATPTPGKTTSPPMSAAPASALSSAPPTMTASAPTSEVSPPEPATDRTSWWPRDVELALDPDSAEPPPAYLTRDDGVSLFYAGRVNGLLAPSESGKTWIALLAVVQAVQAGERASIIDFEDTQRGVTDRLLIMGLTVDQVRSHVAYISPDEHLTSELLPTGRDLAEHLTTWQPRVVVLDGVNAAMTLHGLDLVSNKDATLFAQLVLKPLTKYGACVIYVDHTVKDKDSTSAGGIGAQAKRAMTTGCAIRVNVKKQFGKGQNGTLTLMVDKDRQGDVRGASLPSGEGGHWAGTAQLLSHENGTVTVVIESPGTRIEHQREAPTFRPTVYMERVSRWVEDNPGCGRNVILGAVTGTDRHVKTALGMLIEEGWIEVRKEGQRSLHTSVRPYSDIADLVAPTTGGDWGRTGGEPEAAHPANNWGRLGAAGGDVVPRPSAPSSGPRAVQPGAAVSKVITTIVAGQPVRVDMSTGEVVE